MDSAPFTPGFQRAGPIAQMNSLLREFGVAPADVASGTGIDLEALTPDSRIPFGAVLKLLEQAVELTGCPHFGLLLGSRYDVAAHGLITRFAAQAETLRQALLAFVNLQPGYSSGATVYLSRLRPDFLFGYGIYDRSSLGSAQLYDCVLAFGCNFVRELTLGEISPLEILFCHREPEILAPYWEVMKVPMRFNQTQSGLLIASADIDHTLPTSRKSERGKDVVELKALRSSEASAGGRLRHLIRPQLLAGDASMSGASKALGQIPRTLRRHLAAEGLTFELIRDDVRHVLACELLALTDLPIGEIGASLAFSNPPAFVRAFRRWSGKTPSDWRTSLGQSGDAARPMPRI